MAAIGAGEWEQIEMDVLIKDGFSCSKKDTIQQTREAAAAYQNKLEVFVKDCND